MHSLQAGLHPDILPELQNKGILSSSAYDVAIDYILLDAFDDLTDPPRAVLAVLHGMPFGRQPLLENAVWGIIQAKSKLNFGPFKARYYALMKQVSPYLASGLLECANPYGDPRHRSGPGRFGGLGFRGGFPEHVFALSLVPRALQHCGLGSAYAYRTPVGACILTPCPDSRAQGIHKVVSRVQGADERLHPRALPPRWCVRLFLLLFFFFFFLL